MHKVTWLSGFAFGASIHCFTRHDPESGALALIFSIWIAYMSRMLRPAPASPGAKETEA